MLRHLTKQIKPILQIHLASNLTNIMAISKLMSFLVIIVSVWRLSHGDCSLEANMIDNLMKCKPAVALTNPENPTAVCCTMVQSLKQDDIQCLCDYKVNKGDLLRLAGVDPDRCTQLPKLCGLDMVADC